MNCDISIVVLTYNQDSYIEQTLESIATQKTNWSYEIIVADDCSVDGTRKIIQRLSDKYDSIHPIYNEYNLGVIKNYIKALELCRGKYIMECGGDDYWYPGKIEVQMEAMQNDYDIGMSFGIADMVDENSQKIKMNIGAPKYTQYEHLILFNGICASTSCFKKSLWNRYVEIVKPDSQNWKMEDYPFWIWLSINSKLSFIEEPIACYRVVEGSISHQQNMNKQIEFENSVYDIRTYFSTDTNSKMILINHLNNLAQIYYTYNEIEEYRNILKKEKIFKDLYVDIYRIYRFIFNYDISEESCWEKSNIYTPEK